jgi:hypothetical protein
VLGRDTSDPWDPQVSDQREEGLVRWAAWLRNQLMGQMVSSGPTAHSSFSPFSSFFSNFFSSLFLFF